MRNIFLILIFCFMGCKSEETKKTEMFFKYKHCDEIVDPKTEKITYAANEKVVTSDERKKLFEILMNSGKKFIVTVDSVIYLSNFTSSLEEMPFIDNELRVEMKRR